MFTPKVGTILTIDLPGERVRAPVVTVYDGDHVFVELDSAPMSRTHQYRIGDRVLVQRRDAMMGQSWEVMDEKVLEQQAARAREIKKAVQERKLLLAKKKSAAAKKRAVVAPLVRKRGEKKAPTVSKAPVAKKEKRRAVVRR